MSEKKEKVEQMFDSIAPKYDFLNHLLSLGIDKGWRRRMVRMVAQDSPADLLDVATGTADMVIALHRKGIERITGVDLSEGMLAVGREKLAARGMKVELVQGVAEKLPFDDASFDAVTCAFGVRNFEDTVGGLRQMCRVLRERKKCYILEYSKVNKPTAWSVLFNLYFRHILPLVGGWVSGDRAAYSYLPDSVEQFAAGEEFSALMSEAGFENCSARKMMGGIVTIYVGTKAL